MNSRRTFLKNSLLLSGVASIGQSNLFAAPPLPSSVNADEAYWKLVRLQFPLDSSKIFLNNGTIGPSPYSVVNAVQEEMMNIDTSAHYGGYEHEAIDALARFVNCESEEISLTHNVTEGINIACWGFPLKAGDEVIMTGHEHVGHAAPWLNRAKLDGIKIKILQLGHTAEETLQNLGKVITKKTKVISVPHIPCTIGQVLPIKAICTLAKSKGIYTLIDAAHPPGMLDVDIQDLGCDVYASCCHKWLLGPKGTGFLFVSKTVRNEIQAYYGGGGFDTGWDLLSDPPVLKGYVDTGHRYYYGTQNASLYKGIIRAVEFHEKIGKQIIEKRVKSLANYLQENVLKLSPDIIMLTPTEEISKAAQISFKVKGKEMSDFQKQCNKEKIVTRYVAENDINCMRISTHIYNSFEEIDTFVKQVDQFVNFE
jgi:cysteine desulfurase/selenocysteine lyase